MVKKGGNPVMSALGHPFFDDLRSPDFRLPDGRPLPEKIFEMTEEEQKCYPEDCVNVTPGGRK